MSFGRALRLAILLFAVPPESQAQSGFVDMTRESGIDFEHDPGARGRYLLPEITGSGAALFDYDGDGDLDVYLVQAGQPSDPIEARADAAPNRLFRQNADGRFTDVTEEAGVGDRGYGMGVAVGDIDNDGDLDLYVTNYGPDALYRNEGGGRFVDATDELGISGSFWSASAVFCDYDADGFLDVYVTHYVAHDPDKRCTHSDGSVDYCSPQVFPGTPDALYHNEGGRSFTDVSAGAGIRDVRAPGLGVLCADLNDDGRMDFYVANDGEANQLWQNRGDGTFLDEAFIAGVALNDAGEPEAGMGITAGDADGDGDLDLFMTHIVNQTNTLYASEGALGYSDRSMASGIGASSLGFTGFGTGFLDFDHDGDVDLAVVNGRVQRRAPLPGADPPSPWDVYAEPNQLLENVEGTRFEDRSQAAGDFGEPIEVSRGLALGDVDEDGDLDLLVANAAGQARLYRNEMEKRGDWLVVKARDPALRRDAHGARVTIVAGGKRYLRLASPGYGYLSSQDPRAHFGLPRGSSVTRIEVRWPGGETESFPGGPANRVVVVEKGRGEAR